MSGTCSILNNTMDCDYYYKEKINRRTPHTPRLNMQKTWDENKLAAIIQFTKADPLQIIERNL